MNAKIDGTKQPKVQTPMPVARCLVLVLLVGSYLLILLVSGRCWFRTDDVEVFVNDQRIQSLPTYSSKAGRVLIMLDDDAIVTDSSREFLGFPQGSNWLTTPWLSLGVSPEAMLVPMRKKDARLMDVELRGPHLKNRRIKARLPIESERNTN